MDHLSQNKVNHSEFKSDRARTIHEIFTKVAPQYDQLNDLISFGIHRRWRRDLVLWSGATAGQRVLDLATGTGDLAIEFKRQLGNQSVVTGLDFNSKMLDLARIKSSSLGCEILYLEANATQLPYPDEQFDIVSISYGIRNVDDPGLLIREVYRVLRPGGRFMILETGNPSNPMIQYIFRIYFKWVMPRVAALFGGDLKSYQYLESSAASFPSGSRLVELIHRNGVFSEVLARPLLVGVSWLYGATKAL